MIPIGDALSLISPTAGEIATIFSGFSKMKPEFLQVLLRFLDPTVLEKLATWAHDFAKRLNDLGPESYVSPDMLAKAMTENQFTDFFSAMRGTVYTGPTLDWATLDGAMQEMTTFIKANNWEQAIFTGITLAKFLPA